MRRAAITVTITFSPPSCANASGARIRTPSPTLHRRAGLWYEATTAIAGAVEHALAAEDFERAADLIEEETGARRRYVRRFPAAPLARNAARWAGAPPPAAQPALRLGARPLRRAGATPSAGSGIPRPPWGSTPELRRRSLSDEERTMLGEICIIRARMAAMRENAALTTKLSNRALDLHAGG